jgi:hypothetical protein
VEDLEKEVEKLGHMMVEEVQHPGVGQCLLGQGLGGRVEEVLGPWALKWVQEVQ